MNELRSSRKYLAQLLSIRRIYTNEFDIWRINKEEVNDVFGQ